MVVKSLAVPSFEIHKYQNPENINDIFNEIVFKMAHYYFSIYQALFSKDSKGNKAML
jgi:hypothetical protein